MKKTKKILYILMIMIIPFFLCGCLKKSFGEYIEAVTNINSLKNDTGVEQIVTQEQTEEKKSDNEKEAPANVNLPLTPEIKEHYDSVYEYYQDMKKVQASIYTYTVDASAYVPTVGMFRIAIYKQGDDYYLYIKNFDIDGYVSNLINKIDEENIISKQEIVDSLKKSLPRKELHIDNTSYLFGFPGNNTVAVKIPITFKSTKKNRSLDIKEGASGGIPVIFNWYDRFYEQDAAAKFVNDNAAVDGMACRLINITTKNGTSTNACISDKYGILLYARTKAEIEPKPGISKTVNVFNLKVNNILINFVNDSLLSTKQLPSNLIEEKNQVTLEEFKDLVEIK